MKKLVNDIINKLAIQEVTFGDVRFTSSDEELFYFEKGELKEYGTEMNKTALGIRALANGCWGFAGLNEFTETAIDRAISRAIENARHGSLFKREKVTFPQQKPVITSYFQKPEKDPFLMNKDEKMGFFSDLAKNIHGEGRDKIIFNYLFNSFYRQYKIYANTEGTLTDSLTYNVLPFYQILAGDESGAQSRTYPGHMSAQTGGFEKVIEMNLGENVETCVRQAIELLDAPVIKEEKADIIIGGGHLALQLHESVGHATEADRLFGMEISYAGKTFVQPGMVGHYQYGSSAVNIFSDSSDPRGIGYHPVDDEGIPGKRVDIVKKGILNNLQTDREIAHKLGLQPSSNMKTSHGYDYPLVRMTNFCLMPGTAGSLDDLIKNTEKGYYLDFTKTWSIDDNRNNFQFTTEIGWKIEDGEIKGIVKEPTYYGITPEFWNSCDAVCGPEEWKYHGTFHCGKGEPGQALHLSHGVAPARFKNITVNIKA